MPNQVIQTKHKNQSCKPRLRKSVNEACNFSIQGKILSAAFGKQKKGVSGPKNPPPKKPRTHNPELIAKKTLQEKNLRQIEFCTKEGSITAVVSCRQRARREEKGLGPTPREEGRRGRERRREKPTKTANLKAAKNVSLKPVQNPNKTPARNHPKPHHHNCRSSCPKTFRKTHRNKNKIPKKKLTRLRQGKMFFAAVGKQKRGVSVK